MDDPRKCPHASLSFGSGAYYIFCGHCGQTWVAKKGHGADNVLCQEAGSDVPAPGPREAP